MKLQYLLGTNALGSRMWQDCAERTDEFVDRAATFAKTDRAAVLERLGRRDSVYFAASHNALLRDADLVPPARAAHRPAETITCVCCGEQRPSGRFTTLPISARTCDDCV